MFPHEKSESLTHGRSPGNGITPAPLSAEPLATEGEATPGPDDYNPYEDGGDGGRLREEPTKGDDPYAFDDIGDTVADVRLPGLDPGDDGPLFDF